MIIVCCSQVHSIIILPDELSWSVSSCTIRLFSISACFFACKNLWMVFLSSSEYWFFNRAISSLWALSILSLGTWIIIWNKILQSSNNCHYSLFTWGQWWLKEVLAMASYIWDTLYLYAPTSLPSTADRWYDHTVVCRGRLECSCK